MELNEKFDSANNALERVEKASFDRLSFEFEGIPIEARSEDLGSTGLIVVSATLGRLFYTAEKVQDRIAAIEKVRSTNKGIDGAYRIDRHSKVTFESQTSTDEHMKGDTLIGALTLIMLEAEPHLRAIRSHLKPGS